VRLNLHEQASWPRLILTREAGNIRTGTTSTCDIVLFVTPSNTRFRDSAIHPDAALEHISPSASSIFEHCTCAVPLGGFTLKFFTTTSHVAPGAQLRFATTGLNFVDLPKE
jgi:hypothetical protein